MSGECFEATFKRKEGAANRDGVCYLFRLKDLSKNRGERLVSLYRFGPKEFYAADYDARLETVCFNALRKAFDSGLVTFDALFDEHTYKELPLEASDFAPRSPVSDQAIKQFIMTMTYWLGFRYSLSPRTNRIQFDAPADLAYLGVSSEDVKRYVWLLGAQGFLDNTLEAMGRPTAKLVGFFESQQSISLPNEKVFPKGTQYEAFKEITRILRSANRKIFIADNYLDESILDMLAALPAQPVLHLLTFRPPPDFKVAVKRFQSQYQQPMEVRLHQKEVHDRAIVIDDASFFAIGASIKGIGAKLSLLNRLEDPANIAKLRNELQTIWDSAQPLL